MAKPLDFARPEPATVHFRAPTPEDGAAVWRLIRETGALDENSLYCNLLQCDHFADTCLLAERDGEVVGWVSGYIVPNEPDTLFIWQVGVAQAARGQGLAGRLLEKVIERPACKNVRRMKTTITRDNAASWALFRRFAQRLDAPVGTAAHFTEAAHFDGAHDTEYMVTIGAFGALGKAAA